MMLPIVLPVCESEKDEEHRHISTAEYFEVRTGRQATLSLNYRYGSFAPRISLSLFNTCNLHLELSSLFIYLANTQLDCSKRISQFTSNFTLKCSYMFRFYNHHQGANVRALLKL